MTTEQQNIQLYINTVNIPMINNIIFYKPDIKGQPTESHPCDQDSSFWYTIREAQSAASLLIPALKQNVTLNSCNARLQRTSFALFDVVCVKKIIGLWSEYKVTDVPNNQCLNFCNPHKAAYASFSMVAQCC